jgi:hypothetical protein
LFPLRLTLQVGQKGHSHGDSFGLLPKEVFRGITTAAAAEPSAARRVGVIRTDVFPMIIAADHPGREAMHVESPRESAGAIAFLSVRIKGQGDQSHRRVSAAAAETNNAPPNHPRSRTLLAPATGPLLPPPSRRALSFSWDCSSA